MKSLMLLLIATLTSVASLQAQNDAITKYFNKYVDNPDFSAVYISPKMFDMVSKVEIDEMEPEVQEVIRSMKGLRILHTEKNATALYSEAMKTIPTSEYELLMTARDNNENVRFMVKDKGDFVEELLMIVGGENDFAMISFIGNIDLKKIGKLAKVLEIDNLEHLNNLNKN